MLSSCTQCVRYCSSASRESRCALTVAGPAGFALLLGVLGRGLYSMYAGNQKASYRMMRYRVLFQVGSIAALVYGLYFRPNLGEEEAGGVGKGTVVDKRFFMDYAREIKAPPTPQGKAEELK